MQSKKNEEGGKPADLDDFVDQMQRAVIEDMRKIYSPQVVEKFLNPRNVGVIENPDGFARFTGPCGDTMEMYLRIRDGAVREVKFQTDGCGSSIVCGSMATELAENKEIAEIREITQEKVLDALGGMPEEEEHCALLAATTLNMALNDYLANKREPWKKIYRVRGS